MSEAEQEWDSGEVWKEKTEAAINMLADRMDAATRKSYQIDLLKRCLRRIVQFEPECHDCRVYREKIRLLLKSTDALDIQEKAVRKGFSKQVREISEHLCRTHKLSHSWTRGWGGTLFLGLFMTVRYFDKLIQNDIIIVFLAVGLWGLTMYLSEMYLRKRDRVL